MVLKRPVYGTLLNLLFESSVNSDGTQTYRHGTDGADLFESSVNSDGTQTSNYHKMLRGAFESSVNSDGTQTPTANR